jgi:hypothetical protein
VLSLYQLAQIVSIAKYRKNQENRFAVWLTHREVNLAFNGELRAGVKAISENFIIPYISMVDSLFMVHRPFQTTTPLTVASEYL